MNFPDTKNIRELLAMVRPEIGWPEVAMKALADITTICTILETRPAPVNQADLRAAYEAIAEPELTEARNAAFIPVKHLHILRHLLADAIGRAE